MSTLFQDVRYSLRMLARNPGFTTAVVLTLALGIGANSTIFSWINVTLLNPIPGASHTRELVSLNRGEKSFNPVPPFSYADYMDLRQRNRSFSGLLGFHLEGVGLRGDGKPDHVWSALVSANYFDVLGVRPVLGRGFLPEEEQKPGGAPVVVISYALWQNRFGGDRSVIGKKLEINQHPYTIVGVAPQPFKGSIRGMTSDLWIPLVMDPSITEWGRLNRRDEAWLMLFGRLKPGVSEGQARAEMNLLMQQVAQQYPDAHRGPNQITLDPVWRSPFGGNAQMAIFLSLLMGLAGVVLLLACANVANLLLVRAVARQREIAIRLSIGANRWRVMRQCLTESLLLGLIGGAVALVLTPWAAGSVYYLLPPEVVPASFSIPVDSTVFLATLILSLLSSVGFGLWPALRATSFSPMAVLKEETGSVSRGLHKARLSRTLVVAQISLSLVLLICAGLFIQSLRNALRSDPGFDPKNVLVAAFDLKPAGYSEAQGIEFYRQLLAKLEALPGVESATLANWLPLNGGKHTYEINPEGYVPRPHEMLEVARANVGPNYLRTLRIPILAGRDITPEDTQQSQFVVVVNQALAERYWPGQSAVGKRLHAHRKWFTVVGVAQNCRLQRLNEAAEPMFYLPLSQDFYHDPMIHVRVAGHPQAFLSTVKTAVQQLNPDLPVFNVTSLEATLYIATIYERIAGTFVGTFGWIALMLTAVGIYGVVAYSTRQRTQELGIRMALGAQRGEIFSLVLGQGVRMTAIGLVLGLVVSLLATRLLQAHLLGVTTTDGVTYATVAALLCVVSLAACYLPARRATRIDPLTALRGQ